MSKYSLISTVDHVCSTLPSLKLFLSVKLRGSNFIVGKVNHRSVYIPLDYTAKSIRMILKYCLICNTKHCKVLVLALRLWSSKTDINLLPLTSFLIRLGCVKLEDTQALFTSSCCDVKFAYINHKLDYISSK